MALIRPSEPQPRIVEIGRLHKGGPMGTSSRGYAGGDDLNHFRFEPNERLKSYPDGNGGNVYDALKTRWGELGAEPRTIPIRFLSNDINEIFSASSNEVWSNKNGVKRCVRRCNGEEVLLHYKDGPKPVLSRERIPCAAEPGANKCPFDCKPTGRLNFYIPHLRMPGRVMLTTHSIYDITEIQGNLAAFAGCDFRQIPFLLCRSLKPCNYNKPDGSVVRQEKWLLHLEVDPEMGMLVLNAQAQQYRNSLQAVASGRLSLPPSADPGMQGLIFDDPDPDIDYGETEYIEGEFEETEFSSLPLPSTAAGQKIFADFQEYLNRAETLEQVEATIKWVQDPKKWDAMFPAPNAPLETLINRLILEARNQFALSPA